MLTVATLPPPDGLASWLAVALYLLGIVSALLGVALLIKKLREPKAPGLPSPLTITQHIAYTPQSQHDDLEADFRAFVARTDLRFAEMSKASSASREKIYEMIREEMSGLHARVTDLLGVISEIKGELKHLNPPRK